MDKPPLPMSKTNPASCALTHLIAPTQGLGCCNYLMSLKYQVFSPHWVTLISTQTYCITFHLNIHTPHSYLP